MRLFTAHPLIRATALRNDLSKTHMKLKVRIPVSETMCLETRTISYGFRWIHGEELSMTECLSLGDWENGDTPHPKLVGKGKLFG